MTTGWRRRAGRLLRLGRQVLPRPSPPGPPAAGPSPVELALKRQWARRELYTLGLPQASLDLSQSPLTPGGRIYRAVPIEGPEIVPDYVDGALVLGSPGEATTVETHYRLFALQPFATVEADLAITASAYGVGMIEWMSADGAQRITVWAERPSGTIGAALSVSGTPVAALEPTSADLSGDFTLLAQLQGRSVLVWHRKGRVTTYLGRLDLTAHLDLRDPAVFSTWTLGITARGHTDLQVRCTRFAASLSGNGHADPRIVSYEDGTPVADGSTVWFLATTRGADIADAFQGVYSLDVASGRIAMTGALFGNRDGDGVWRNDNAGHLFLDRRTKTWTWLAVGHSDHPGPRPNWVGTSRVDLRSGVNQVPVRRVVLPDDGLWEDMYPVRDGARWTATASKDARHTAWLESTSGLEGPWTETRTAVGMHETGQLIVRSGGRRYVVAGTDTAAYVVRDAEVDGLTDLGGLDLDVDTGARRVWPALFALPEPDGVRWYLLTFDRTSPAGRFSYGRLYFYRQA